MQLLYRSQRRFSSLIAKFWKNWREIRRKGESGSNCYRKPPLFPAKQGEMEISSRRGYGTWVVEEIWRRRRELRD